jgi:hypothetical protein
VFGRYRLREKDEEFTDSITLSLEKLKIAFFHETTVSEWRSSSSWFRTQAFQACDPGFKSRRPHQLTFLIDELKLFI